MQKALDEIESSKRLALERYKADELKRMAEERENLRQEREVKDREFHQGLVEPESGMLNKYKEEVKHRADDKMKEEYERQLKQE